MNLVVAFDSIPASHEEVVFSAYNNIKPDNTIFSNVHINYHPGFETDVFAKADYFKGIADVINWSFRNLEYTTEYTYNNVIKDCFLNNTAVTVAAGNDGANVSYTSFRTDIGELQSSPYDFTCGSIKTFNWGAISPDVGRATKIAKFELADFSEVTPKFVDFYTYGDGGTSYAAPTVAALISKIKLDHPEYTLNEIRTVLERNSKHMTFERNDTEFVAQVLDPFDLQHNLIRDGRVGQTTNLFTDNITRDDYTFTLDTKHKIDAHAKLDGMYEIFYNKNHDQASFDQMMSSIDNGWSIQDAIVHFVNTREANIVDQAVSIIEQVQALYHVTMSREPTLNETTTVIDYYRDTGENFNQLAVDFVGYYKVDLEQLSW